MGNIHDETVVFEHVSSGMGPDDDTEKRAVRYYEDVDEIPTNQQ